MKMRLAFDSNYSWSGHSTKGTSGIDGCDLVKIGSPNDHDRYSPPNLIVMAVEGCFASHMIKEFGNSSISLLDYESESDGYISGNAKDGMQFGKIVINAIITVDLIDEDKIRQLIDKAQSECLAARSLNCPVEAEVKIQQFPEVK